MWQIYLKYRVIFWTLALSSLALVLFNRLPMTRTHKMEIILFDNAWPLSFDPMDADRAVNLYVMRMLYLTPVELSPSNKLVSTVLTDFGYSPEKREIRWVVRPDLFFEDGSRITPRDVVLPVLRMALTRPQFPVVNEIGGVADWRKLDFPLEGLPSGITIRGNEILIKLMKDVSNPLYRFGLEIFSVVPTGCIDLKTNKLLCDRPPASGYYKIASEDGKRRIEFSKRLAQSAHKLEGPERIDFSYISPSELINNPGLVNKGSVLFGVELNYFSSGLDALGGQFNFQYLPMTLFSSILVNPTVPPFQIKSCRQAFAQKLRDTLSSTMNNGVNPSSSIFVPLVPGYLSHEQLSAHGRNQGCSAANRGQEILIGRIAGRPNSFIEDILGKSLAEFGVKYRYVELSSVHELESSFLRGQIAIRSFGSGFWAFDPVHDVRMLFAENMHPTLEFVTQDKVLKGVLDDLKIVADSDVPETLKKLNRLLFDDAKMNIIFHSRRMFATGDSGLLRELPQGGASIALWQIFR